MLHHEISRHRAEAPRVPTAGAARQPDWGAERVARHREPSLPKLADLVPWILAAVAVAALMSGLRPFQPDRCMNLALERNASSWGGGAISLWPPGATCPMELAGGEQIVIHERSWAPVIGLGVALGVWSIGLIRPPSPAWRRAAQALSVPILLAALAWLALAFEGEFAGQAAFAVGAILAVGLLPAAITLMVVYAVKGAPAGRTLATAWLIWSAVIAGLFAL